MKFPEVKLRSGRERSIQHRHPWVFSGALEREYKHISDGQIVKILSSQNTFLGLGHFYNSSIAIKIFSFKAEVIDYKFWRERIKEAYQLREKLGLFSSSKTNAFRLVNAEGDGLPGMIIDLYNRTAVIQFQSEGMRLLEETFSLALREVLGERLEAIFVKRLEDREKEGDLPYLYGSKGDNIIQENSLKFEIDWERGQKTGFFLDQRHNRELVRLASADREVLNCFSYSGAFSVYALKGGAKYVTSLDASEAAGTLCKRNIELNFASDERISQQRFIQTDCLDFLRKLDREYDLIILDPPAFAKHRSSRGGGIRGYDNINFNAFKQIKKGGILFTFSCSQQVSAQDFSEIIRRAASRAGRDVQILQHLSAAYCHPVSLSHPEGEYLKGLMLRVE